MLQVIKLTILFYIRDKKQALFYLIFPIFLVLLLGNVLSAVMSQDDMIGNDEIIIYYLSESDGESSKVFNEFYNRQNDFGFEFKKVSSIEEGKNKVQLNKGFFIYIFEDKIEYYSNEKSSTSSAAVFQTLKNIVDIYNNTNKIYELTGNIINDDLERHEYFNIEEISNEHSPTSMEYYGVVELGLMCFYFINYALFSIKCDERDQLKDRISITGIKTYEYYLGKVIGNITALYITIVSAYIVLRYIFGINYGKYIGVMPIALFIFVCIAVSIGALIGVLVKDESKADSILMSVVIPILSFLGGGYIVLGDDLGIIGNMVARISPLRTFSQGVLGILYGHSSINFIIWVLGGVAVFIIINLAIILAVRRKEEVYE